MSYVHTRLACVCVCVFLYHTFVSTSASLDAGGSGACASEVDDFEIESATLPTLNQTGKGWYFQLFMSIVLVPRGRGAG